MIARSSSAVQAAAIISSRPPRGCATPAPLARFNCPKRPPTPAPASGGHWGEATPPHAFQNLLPSARALGALPPLLGCAAQTGFCSGAEVNSFLLPDVGVWGGVSTRGRTVGGGGWGCRPGLLFSQKGKGSAAAAVQSSRGPCALSSVGTGQCLVALRRVC